MNGDSAVEDGGEEAGSRPTARSEQLGEGHRRRGGGFTTLSSSGGRSVVVSEKSRLWGASGRCSGAEPYCFPPGTEGRIAALRRAGGRRPRQRRRARAAGGVARADRRSGRRRAQAPGVATWHDGAQQRLVSLATRPAAGRGAARSRSADRAAVARLGARSGPARRRAGRAARARARHPRRRILSELAADEPSRPVAAGRRALELAEQGLAPGASTGQVRPSGSAKARSASRAVRGGPPPTGLIATPLTERRQARRAQAAPADDARVRARGDRDTRDAVRDDGAATSTRPGLEGGGGDRAALRRPRLEGRAQHEPAGSRPPQPQPGTGDGRWSAEPPAVGRADPGAHGDGGGWPQVVMKRMVSG